VTGELPASPVRKDEGEGSFTRMSLFLTGKPCPEGRAGFTRDTRVSIAYFCVAESQSSLLDCASWEIKPYDRKA
jgi:hypothetical protein